MLRSFARAFTALAAMVSFGQALPARAAATWTANADDALLFEVHLSKYRIGDGVRGYQTPRGVCVDFADTLLALDIPIRLDKQSRRAKGWAFEESHVVDIDRVAGIEHIANITREVALDDIYDTKEGWCVDTRSLSRWLGVGLTPDTGNAVLVVNSATKLPVQAAAERRARAASPRAPPAFDLASLPHSRVTTRGISVPAVDVVASIGGLRDRQAGQRLDFQTIAIGDVAGASSPLVASSRAGRGALVTNRPIERLARFDKIDLRGELPRGWDAELYRNGQLLAFAQDRTDGRYEFLDVPLQYGQNRLEVVLYGPQGQVRREVHSVPVGLDSIPPRKTYYWLGVDEDGRDLITLGRSSDGPGGWRGSFGLERGLDARTSIAAFVHSSIVEGTGRHNYVEASFRRAFGSALVEASGAADLGGGHALRLQAIGDLGRTRYNVETIWARDYRSDRVQADLTGLHTLTIDRVFGDMRRSIPVSVSARLTTRSTGDDSLDVDTRVSAGIGRVSLTGELAWLKDFHRSLPSTDRLDAGLLADAHVGRIRVRGEARFTILPEARFVTATLIGEWTAGLRSGQITDSHAPSWRAQIGYDRALSRGRIGVGYVRRFDRLALTATGELASDGSVAAGLNIAFSFGPNPRAAGGLRMVADKLAARGSALVRVYRDLNGNGHHDVGEPWEKDVAVTAGRIPVDAPTDARGEAVVDGLQPYQPVLIGIDAASLPDPFVRASIPGMVVTPRPGTVVVVDIPLVGTGEIDGTLIRQAGGPLEGVDLELIDNMGSIASRTRTDFDGYFLFETMPYGRYRIRIAKLSAAAIQTGMALEGEMEITAKKPSVHFGALAARSSTLQAAY